MATFKTIDQMRTCFFLQSVAEEYSIDYGKLQRGVSDAFTRHQQDNLDPDGDYLDDTKHFAFFVTVHQIKEVNVGTVVLYVKGVELSVSHKENFNLMIDLEDENKTQNEKINFIRLILCATSSALFAFSFLI